MVLARHASADAPDAGAAVFRMRLHLTSEWNAGMVHWDV